MSTQSEFAKDQLARACAQFDDAVEHWKNQAKQSRDCQSERHQAERLINRSPALIAGMALGIPFVALLVYLIFG
jgi:hypothetical protein